MDFEIVTNIITQIGFPIFVAVYLLFMFRDFMDKMKEEMALNRTALQELQKYIVILTEHVKGVNKINGKY